jgi:hypothetical protein
MSQDEELAESRRKEIEDIKWLMAHKAGRRLAWRLLERAGVYRTSFNNSGSITAFNEGQRNMGLFLLAELQEISPDNYLAMIKERNE